MAKALKTVGKVAGVVAGIALIGTGIGAALGGTMILAGVGSAASIASVAGAVSAIANMGSQALAKPPPARGSVSQTVIETNPPQPYVMGEGYFAGVLRHDAGYGATLKKVPNPYRGMVAVYSGAGPVQSITPKVEFANVSSWYSGFLYTDTQLGATPEAGALTPHFSGMPGWGSAHKLSGQASILWNLKFDRDGKRFASGVPMIGAEGRWVKVYDPRKDSTFPGGSGAHRLGQESTYEWSENPALHAGTYAFGRYQNGKRVVGMGLPRDGIDWQVVAAWANVCEANAWTMFGVVFEPGDRWANLKDICFAGGGEPVPGGTLTFRYSAPVVALDTVTADDLTEEASSVVAMQSFRDRINTAIPKYRSPLHNWELVDGEAVSIPTFLSEDGEEKRETWPFNFVKKPTQAAQLATYRIWDSRELAPITIMCKPRLRTYRPGECLELDLPELGIAGKAIILKRQIDPATMTVTLELLGETSEKHAYCLGRTGTPPPTPALQQTPQEKDELAAAAIDAPSAARRLVTRTVQFPVSSTTNSISVQAFDGVLGDGRTISFPAATMEGVAPSTTYAVLFDLTAGTYFAEPLPATAALADSANAFLFWQSTPDGGGTYTPPPDSPPGYGGTSDPDYNTP